MSSHHFQHPHHEPIPIPDLRFEYSYLRGIKKYVETKTVEVSHVLPADEKHHANETYTESDVQTSRTRTEVVSIRWRGVAWVTVRDQILSPFLQGALWALISYWITPVSASIGSKLGGLTRNGFLKKKEGKGANWLRSWVAGLGLAGGSSFTGVAK